MVNALVTGKERFMWRTLLGLCLVGLLSGCVHQEAYDHIVARNGRPTELTQNEKTITATWGTGADKNWVAIDKQTQRIVDSSENSKFKCRYLGLCEFER
jgi:predicted exporter